MPEIFKLPTGPEASNAPTMPVGHVMKPPCRCRARNDLESMAGLRGPQEAVIHTTRVSVVSRTPRRWVVAKGERALAGACARARSVERRDGAVGSAQEAGGAITRVTVISRVPPRLGEA